MLVCERGFTGIVDNGRQVAEAGDDRVFLDWPITLQARDHKEHIELGGPRLQLRHALVHAFKKTRCWAGTRPSTGWSRVGLPWLAVASPAVSALEYLTACGYRFEEWKSLPGWQIVPQRAAGNRGSEVGAGSDSAGTSSLGNAAHCSTGGLALGRRRYMLTGAPDLVVPDSPEALEVRLNGEVVATVLTSDDAIVRFADLVVDAGRYRVEIGDQEMSLSSLRRLTTMYRSIRCATLFWRNLPHSWSCAWRAGHCLMSRRSVARLSDLLSSTSIPLVPSSCDGGLGSVRPGRRGDGAAFRASIAGEIGEPACHFAVDDLTSAAAHPVSWIGRVMSGRVQMTRGDADPGNVVTCEPIGYFGERQVLVAADRVSGMARLLRRSSQRTSLDFVERRRCPDVPWPRCRSLSRRMLIGCCSGARRARRWFDWRVRGDDPMGDARMGQQEERLPHAAGTEPPGASGGRLAQPALDGDTSDARPAVQRWWLGVLDRPEDRGLWRSIGSRSGGS